MNDIEFSDEFEEETDICFNCGAEAVLTGWNEEKDMSRYECGNCDIIFSVDGKGNERILKGQKMDWEKFLSKNLTFPFDVCIDEHQGDDLFEEVGPLRYGDKVVVQKISGEFDLYGVIAEIKKGKQTYQIPLCDLAIEDKKSPNFKFLDNYGTWFANCR